ncbi:MAG: ABC transporter ATP-binding protein [Bdellovibrio sp.]|nr:ABC transporter ATP-binding protein [Bdellovibrio sp.]
MTAGQKELLRIIFFNRFRYRIAIVLLALLSSVCGLLLPYFQKQFSTQLDYLTLAYCVLLALVYFGFNQLTAFVGQSESIHAQKILAQKIYEQTLRLKSLTLQNRNVGEIVSLYTTDVPSLTVWLEQSLPYGFTTLFPLILTPWFLSSFYGLPLKLSLTLIFVLIALNGAMAYRQSIFFFKFKKLAADRMGLVNEWIQNIRGLKILNWIDGFETTIIKKRREETRNRIAMVTNGQVMNSISSSVTFWLNLAVIAFFIWIEPKALDKAELIGLLWITTVFLSRPLRQLPWFFTFLFDAWTSYRRLAEFLTLINRKEIIHSEEHDPQSLVEVRNLTLSLNNKPLLNIEDFKVTRPEIIALVGPVGAGKSLFLKSLAKETSFEAARFFIGDSSYIPQEYFVMSASLRDNVNFNYQSPRSEDEAIMAALKKAQFDFELDRVENGLETFIGERGLNLSGGQKQRVSLARQFKNLKKLILLDDPLSAVDISTEYKLIQELIKLRESGHSLLLTTQRFTALQHCDRIVYLQHGEILFDGTSQAFLQDEKYQSFIKGTF